jgi:hypothetical protein
MMYSAYAIVIAMSAATLFATPAHAQVMSTFVSASGNDADDCTRATPCRTLAVAITKTDAGGEIKMLDPADYGPVTVTKAISIVNAGPAAASVLVPRGQSGIMITAGASDVVNLRGLMIDGARVGTTGIGFTSGKSLIVDNCSIRNFTASGISFISEGVSYLLVSNSVVANNGGQGIVVQPSGAGSVNAFFRRVEAYNNAYNGIGVYGNLSSATVRATVTDSVAAGNVGAGFVAVSGGGDTSARLMLVRSVTANNGTGISASGANATVWVGQTTVNGNMRGWETATDASLKSYGDNNIDGNSLNEERPTIITKK